MYFEELLKQITGEADLGVFLIVYAIGYFLAALVKVDASPLGIQGGYHLEQLQEFPRLEYSA